MSPHQSDFIFSKILFILDFYKDKTFHRLPTGALLSRTTREGGTTTFRGSVRTGSRPPV
jgi:hypothetical protein